MDIPLLANELKVSFIKFFTTGEKEKTEGEEVIFRHFKNGPQIMTGDCIGPLSGQDGEK